MLGALCVARFPVLAAVDEPAHVSFVEEVAEHGRLPILGRDPMAADVIAFQHVRPGDRTLAGQSYEAFQPPLFYAVAAPVFAAGGSLVAKVRLVRALVFVLMLAAAALLWPLAVEVLGRERAPLAYAVALGIMVWPGFVLRGATVSNDALLLPLVPLFLLVLHRAHVRHSGRLLVAAGALLGLCLLTKLTAVYLVPLLLVVAVRQRSGAAVAALALPALMLAPWVASNESRYGTLTANEQAKRLQEPVLNPSGRQFGVGDLPHRVEDLAHDFVPEEWDRLLAYVGAHAALSVPLQILAWLAVLLAPLGLLGVPPPARGRVAGFLLVPIALGVLETVAILLFENWPVFNPRLLHAAVLPAALLIGLGLRRLLGTTTRATWAAAALTLFTLGYWVHIASAGYLG